MENRICVLCGDEFTPTHPRQKVCTKQHYRPCCICGTPIPIKRPSDPKYVCSLQCEMENRRRHNVEKYGVDHPMQLESVRKKHRESMKEIYGVESPLQSEEIKQRAIKSNRDRFGSDWALGSEIVQEKRRATMVERYGVEHPFQMDDFQQKSEETMLRKYGVTASARIPGIQDKIRATCIDRYGARNPMMCKAVALRAKESRIRNNGKFWTPEMRKKAESTFMKHYGVNNPSKAKCVTDKIASTLESHYGETSASRVPALVRKHMATSVLKFGVPYYVVSDQFNASDCCVRISDSNKRFSKLLDAKSIKHSFEYRIGLKCYDICLESEKTLIEIDPTYTHSILPNHMRKIEFDRNYHVIKTDVASRNGFRCIHVFDWNDKSKIVDLVAQKQVVYARKCEIRSISIDDANEFEQINHLSGGSSRQTVCYGLYYNGSLIQVIGFGKPQFSKAYQYEMIRLCSARGFAIVGGAERLFAKFVNDNKPESVVSYSDRSKFTGNVYTRLGFHHLLCTPPNKIWSKKSDRISNNALLAKQYTKSDFDDLISSGWRPIYDCGYDVFVYHSR